MVSFVLLNWNSGNFIYDCLLSIKRQSSKNWELIIVDNGSKISDLEELRSFCLREDIQARWKLLDENKGYAIGMNVGLSLTEGSIMIAMNTDVFLPPYFLEKLLVFVEKRNTKNLGIIAVPVYRWHYKDNILSNEKYSDGSSVNIRLSSASWNQKKDNMNILYGSDGSIQIISRFAYCDVVKEYGEYYDERFNSYFEDTDSYFKMKSLGYLAVIDDSNRAWHIGSASTSLDGRRKIKRNMRIQMHKNRWYIFTKFSKKSFLVIFSLLFEDIMRYILYIGLKSIVKNYIEVYNSTSIGYKPFDVKLKKTFKS